MILLVRIFNTSLGLTLSINRLIRIEVYHFMNSGSGTMCMSLYRHLANNIKKIIVVVSLFLFSDHDDVMLK